MLRLDSDLLLLPGVPDVGGMFGRGPFSAALLLRIRRVNGLVTEASEGCCTTL